MYFFVFSLSHQNESFIKRGIKAIDKVIVIDQSPIGRTPRSNPATYTGAFDPIRQIFTATVEAKARGYQAGQFSFNVKGGRCEACKGQGVNVIAVSYTQLTLPTKRIV